MADTKISALTASTTPLAGTEVLPIVQSGVTKQVSVANLTAGRAISATELTLTTGNLIVSSGKGIDFSATPGTGTSELLNDYEEGTWTPNFNTLTIGDGTLFGRYTKIGRTVTCEFGFIFGSTSSFSGAIGSCGGFPFTSSNLGANTYSPIVGSIFDVGAGWYKAFAQLTRNSNFCIGPDTLDPKLAISAISPMVWAAGDTLVMSVTYETA